MSRPPCARPALLGMIGVALLFATAPLFVGESRMHIAVANAATQTEETNQVSAPRCLSISQVTRTSVPDQQHLVFYMRDGKVWENTLKQTCPGLNYSPWAWVVQGTSTVCANAQSLRVTQTGAVCTLGAFALPRSQNKD